MTTTEQLIQRLAADVRPLPRTAALRRLTLGIAAGTVVSAIAIGTWFGAPLQALQSTGAAAFAMKLLFSAALFTASVSLLFIAARPGHKVRMRWLFLLVPPTLVALVAVAELSMAAPQGREQLWFGSTWQTCLVAIIAMSAPIFAGILWAFQRLAPTNLRLGGLLAGLAAGSAAAVLYALYCPETTATFLLSWYSLGIVAAGIAGALAGPRLLRW